MAGGAGLRDVFCWALDHASGMQPFQVVYRWGHLLGVMVFVGLTAFFNLLMGKGPQSPGFGMDRGLLRRAFGLWRWSALLLLFCGLNLLHMIYNFPSRNYFGGDKGLGMACAAALGTVLIALAWLWIWPAQRRHLDVWEGKGSVPRYLEPRAERGLRILTLLLAPTVLGMSLGAHGLTLFHGGWSEMGADLGLGMLPVAVYYGWAGAAGRKV